MNDDGNNGNPCQKCNGCLRNTVGKPYRNEKERVWDMIRAANTAFCVSDVTPDDVHVQVARQVVKNLFLAGVVTKTEKQAEFGKGVKATYYVLAKDCGYELPRYDKYGKPKPPTTYENMWRTLKINRSTNADQLAAMSSTEEVPVSVRTANAYLQQLHKAGYLSLVSKATHAKKAVYMLINNTGAKPPQVLKTRVVYDPNINKVMHKQCVCDAYEEVAV